MKRIFILLTLLSSLSYVPNALAQSGSRICDSDINHGQYVFEVKKGHGCNWFYFHHNSSGGTAKSVGGTAMTCEAYAKKHFGKPADICQIMRRVTRGDHKRDCVRYKPFHYLRRENGYLSTPFTKRSIFKRWRNYEIQDKCVYKTSWLKQKVKTAKRIVKKVKYCKGACRKGSPRNHTKTVVTWEFK